MRLVNVNKENFDGQTLPTGSLVPEVGIPSINELVLSEVEGGQAHRHGVDAPRDFESRPHQQAISHHFQLVKNQLFIKLIWNNLGQFGLFMASMVTLWLHQTEDLNCSDRFPVSVHFL
jgi:hypothetical protein